MIDQFCHEIKIKIRIILNCFIETNKFLKHSYSEPLFKKSEYCLFLYVLLFYFLEG